MSKRDHDHVLQTLKECGGSFTISITRAAGESGPKTFMQPVETQQAAGTTAMLTAMLTAMT